MILNKVLESMPDEEKRAGQSDDHFYPEIVNSITNEVLEEQQPGELVLTTLSREATPVIRYRTGKRAMLNRETCSCGRTSPRLILLS